MENDIHNEQKYTIEKATIEREIATLEKNNNSMNTSISWKNSLSIFYYFLHKYKNRKKNTLSSLLLQKNQDLNRYQDDKYQAAKKFLNKKKDGLYIPIPKTDTPFNPVLLADTIDPIFYHLVKPKLRPLN